jgi:diadenosine tetraphosphate (Ap4A) HIT family hydrolase
MATLFTRIINGEIPGRFVWEDEHVVGFLTIAPITPGHTLVVPRTEVDHWIEAESDLLVHAAEAAKAIGTAIDQVFSPTRIALIVAGFEVPHMHIHVLGADGEDDLSFTKADPGVAPEVLDDAQERLKAALRALGHGEAVPAD